MEQSLIVIEFNELCPSLMNRFMCQDYLPHFKRFYRESEIYITDAAEEGEDLNPWVQWVTVHSGLTAEEHKIKTLSQGHLLPTKAIWDLLSNAGYRVWICGSMNVRYEMDLHGSVLPDPWSTGIVPYPVGTFEPYHQFVRSMVQEHTNESVGMTNGPQAFLNYMLRHGLSLGTVAKTVRQLASEQVTNTKWKRAAIMDQFQWDIFRHYYHHNRPHFSTFFLNSTAHFQHSYWRHMEPDKFLTRPNCQEQDDLHDAILYGYKHMDALIGRFMKLAGTTTTLMFCTALSQQPYLDYESTGGRHYYRVRSEKSLREQLNIKERFTYEPVMAEQFYLRFDSEEASQKIERQMQTYRVEDKRVFPDERTRLFHLTRQGNAILAQCRCTSVVPDDAVITAVDSSRSVPFFDVFYQVDTTKSGRHHPDGMLWIRHSNRRHQIYPDKVSLCSIAPTVMQMFDVSVPSYMTAQALPC